MIPYITADSLTGSISALLHWTLIPDHATYGHDYIKGGQPGLSVQECKAECERLTEVCRSINYRKDHVCFIDTISPLLVALDYDQDFDSYIFCEMRITNGGHYKNIPKYNVFSWQTHIIIPSFVIWNENIFGLFTLFSRMLLQFSHLIRRVLSGLKSKCEFNPGYDCRANLLCYVTILFHNLYQISTPHNNIIMGCCKYVLFQWQAVSLGKAVLPMHFQTITSWPYPVALSWSARDNVWPISPNVARLNTLHPWLVVIWIMWHLVIREFMHWKLLKEITIHFVN